MLTHHVAVALRSFRRAPAAALLNVFTLALGLVCFVTVSAIIGFWERADQHLAKADRTYVVTSRWEFPEGDFPPRLAPRTTHYVAQYLKADFPAIESVARVTLVNDNASYVSGDRAIRIAEYGVDGELLDILDLPFIEGDPHDALKRPLSVVLTEQAARQLFGSESALGKTVLLGAVWNATVTGVVAAIPEPTHMGRSATAPFPFDALTSRDVYESVLRTRFGFDTTTIAENWGNGSNMTYVLLPADGSLTADSLRAQLPEFVARHMPAGQAERMRLTLDLVPLTDVLEMSTDQFLGGGGPSLTAILWVLGALVLGVACVNYANLAIGRSAFRARDVGVRKAMGATVRQIMAQSLVESAMLTTVALAIALGIVALLAPPLLTATGIDVRVALLSDLPSWAMIVALVAGVTVAAGALPAIALARTRPVFALHGGAARLGPRLLSTVLVGTQFFVTSFLLIAVSVSYLQNRQLQRAGLGANTEPLLVVENYAALTSLPHERLHQELLRLPGVRAETATVAAPWIGADGDWIRKTPDASAAARFSLNYAVSDDFFETFEIPLLAGRALRTDRGDMAPDDPAATTRVVIDRELGAALGFVTPEAAVGEVVYSTSGDRPSPFEIVGVVETRRLNISSIGFGAASSMYWLASDPTFHVVRIAATDVRGTVAAIDALWKRLVPNMAPNRRFVDEYFEEGFEAFARINQGFIGLALFTMLIATVGLFAMALFVVARRAREIAVRKVLGAKTRSIVSLLLQSFAMPVLVASVVAWPVAYVAARGYLQQFADPIRLSPWPFVACLAFTLLIAAIAVGGQTLRAARPPPADALRSE